MKKATNHILTLIIFITICFAIVFGLYYVGVLALKLDGITLVMGEKTGTFTTGFIVISLLFAIIGVALGSWKIISEIYLWIVDKLENRI